MLQGPWSSPGRCLAPLLEGWGSPDWSWVPRRGSSSGLGSEQQSRPGSPWNCCGPVGVEAAGLAGSRAAFQAAPGLCPVAWGCPGEVSGWGVQGLKGRAGLWAVGHTGLPVGRSAQALPRPSPPWGSPWAPAPRRGLGDLGHGDTEAGTSFRWAPQRPRSWASRLRQSPAPSRSR